MTPLFRSLIPALCLALASSSAGAQLISSSRRSITDQFTGSISLLGGIPVGEFRDHENGGMGGEVVFGFQPIRRQPLVFRLSGGGMQYSTVRAWGYEDVCDTNGCYTDEVEYNARSHNMWYMHVGTEFMAVEGPLQPFVVASVGYTWFNSRSNLKPTTPTGTENSESLFWSSNVSTQYGGGVRWLVNNGGRQFGIEISPRFTRNAKASYLNEDGLRRQPDGTWVINPRHGAANLVGIQLGFWMGPRVHFNER